jgi:hypothetical protein
VGDIAIRVENPSKQYRIGGPSTGLRVGSQARYRTRREALVEVVTELTESYAEIPSRALSNDPRAGGRHAGGLS